jgi:hypothetical protein
MPRALNDQLRHEFNNILVPLLLNSSGRLGAAVSAYLAIRRSGTSPRRERANQASASQAWSQRSRSICRVA